jgi:anaerobic selenocysteine-containing dehydrogenase
VERIVRTAVRTCPLCEATCGLQLHLDAGDRVVKVTGDELDVFSRGYLCPKGATFGELEQDPDRVTRPRVRDAAGAWHEVAWEEAFAEVHRRLRPIVDEHGPDAVAVYLGNPNVHNLAGQLYVKPLLKALRTRNIFSASTVDQMPMHVACGWMYGDPGAIPVPDIDRTDWLLVLGGNPRMSNGSLWTAPDLPGRLDALRARGGRLVVVDPRRSRTAARADEHVAIRPGTDALLLAAIATTLFEEDLVRLGALADHVAADDLARLRVVLAPFTAETVAAATGVAAATTRRLARELAASEQGSVYGRIGTTTTRFGTLAAWLQNVCNVLVGALDAPGGAMFPHPAHQVGVRPKPYASGRWTSRVRGLPEANGELPVATLADEIETPGEGQVRALVTIAGNPVRSTPNSERLDAAIAGLDLVVSVDPYVNATTRHAHVLLPPPPATMRAHYDLAFSSLAVRDVANFSPPVVPLSADARDEWKVLLTLAAIALGQGPDVDVDAADAFVASTLAQQVVATPGSRLHGADVDAVLACVSRRRGPERLLDLLLRAGPYGAGLADVDDPSDEVVGTAPEGDVGPLSLDVLERHPHGVDLGALAPRLPGRLATASGRIDLVPDLFVADLDRLERALDDDPDGFLLVGRRHLRTNNSWGGNVPSLAKGRDLCTLQVHPDDAARLGLVDGGAATVRSRVGAVVAPVEVTDEIRPGVVSLPHGFGADTDGIEQRVATGRPGVNSNVLTDEDDVDPISGTATLNAIPVTLAPA